MTTPLRPRAAGHLPGGRVARVGIRAEASLPPGYTMEVHEEMVQGYIKDPPYLKVTIVVKHAGQPAAALGVTRTRDPRPRQEGEVFSVNAIEVYPEHQRKGLATAMYAELHRRYPDTPVSHSWGMAQSGDARALNDRLKQRFPGLHFGSKTAAILPPRPGTVPVPAGKVRCHTVVGAIGSGASAEVIRREGLRVDLGTAYQDQFGEFQAIWATTGAADVEVVRNRPVVVEFAAPAEEVVASAGSAAPGRTVTFGRDIPPSEFLYVYETWHGVLWMLQDESGWTKEYLSDPANDWTWKENPDPYGIPDEAWDEAMGVFLTTLGL